MHTVCPGAKMIRQPKPEMFDCPQCGSEVEIWTDELKGVCPQCKTTLITREWYAPNIGGIENGRCASCGRPVDIVLGSKVGSRRSKVESPKPKSQ